MVEHTFDPPRLAAGAKLMETSGKEFGIFQSNTFSHCLHRFGRLLTPGAREVMEWHAREACPNCKKLRVVDHAQCEHCGAGFAPPEKTGTEVFAPLGAKEEMPGAG